MGRNQSALNFFKNGHCKRNSLWKILNLYELKSKTHTDFSAKISSKKSVLLSRNYGSIHWIIEYFEQMAKLKVRGLHSSIETMKASRFNTKPVGLLLDINSILNWCKKTQATWMCHSLAKLNHQCKYMYTKLTLPQLQYSLCTLFSVRYLFIPWSQTSRQKYQT